MTYTRDATIAVRWGREGRLKLCSERVNSPTGCFNTNGVLERLDFEKTDCSWNCKAVVVIGQHRKTLWSKCTDIQKISVRSTISWPKHHIRRLSNLPSAINNTRSERHIVGWEPDCSISTFLPFLDFYIAGFAIRSSIPRNIMKARMCTIMDLFQ